MLIWMCALHCEAKAVIDFYRLKKSAAKTDFDIYSHNDMACIVSGIGADNMTRATRWAYTQLRDEKKLYWINIGIAGHKNLPIGTTVLARKITQYNANNGISSTTNINHPFESRPVISLSEQKIEYDESALFDMEAFAFMQTAANVTALELCQVIKVISDNQHIPPTRNKAAISKLLADNMQPIAEFSNQLQNSKTKHHDNS